jgi:RimJ/RimL family protein N-acetyltransferase
MAGPEPVAGPTRRPQPLADPDLVGPAVRLRAWREPDASALAAAWEDEVIRRWTGVPEDCTVEAARRWIEGEGERRARRVALDLVVAPTSDADDRVLGEVGLGPIQWDRRRAMVGYWTAAGERGRGVATAAVRLLVPWALDALALDEIVAETAVANPASAAVLRTTGFDLAVERDGRQAWRRLR